MADQPVTTLLMEWRTGNQDAGRELFSRMQPELRRIAAMYMRRERPGHTLQPTALVNELYLRFIGNEPVQWQDRAHFLAVASQQLRSILVNAARARKAAKRGRGVPAETLKEGSSHSRPMEDQILDLHIALEKLAELDARAAQVIELRYFGGLTEKEAAEATGISVATLKRDWEIGRAFLIDQLLDSGHLKKITWSDT